MPSHLIADIPTALEERLKTILSSGEVVHVKLKGVNKEVLICTNRRAIILKTGFTTGSTFGVNVFQAPYRNISSVDVDFHLMSGVFEILTGGGQGKKKSYWGLSRDRAKASEEQNCISLLRNTDPDKFREAANFIMEMVHNLDHGMSAPPPAAVSLADELRKLADLRKDGILTDSEFEAQKATLMGVTPPQPNEVRPPDTNIVEPEEDFSAADAAIRRALAQRPAVPFGGSAGSPARTVFGKRGTAPQ